MASLPSLLLFVKIRSISLIRVNPRQKINSGVIPQRSQWPQWFPLQPGLFHLHLDYKVHNILTNCRFYSHDLYPGSDR